MSSVSEADGHLSWDIPFLFTKKCSKEGKLGDNSIYAPNVRLSILVCFLYSKTSRALTSDHFLTRNRSSRKICQGLAVWLSWFFVRLSCCWSVFVWSLVCPKTFDAPDNILEFYLWRSSTVYVDRNQPYINHPSLKFPQREKFVSTPKFQIFLNLGKVPL